MKYGERLEHLLLQAKKSRSEFGAAIGCTVQNLSQIFSDRRGTDQKLMLDSHFKAAEFLGVDPVELYTGISAPYAGATNFSESACDLATLYDMIPRSNLIDRIEAYNAAAAAIVPIVQRLRTEIQLQDSSQRRLSV